MSKKSVVLYLKPYFFPHVLTDVPLAICMAQVMICSMSISSLCSLERYSYRDPPLAYSEWKKQTPEQPSLKGNGKREGQ